MRLLIGFLCLLLISLAACTPACEMTAGGTGSCSSCQECKSQKEGDDCSCKKCDHAGAACSQKMEKKESKACCGKK